MADVDFIEEIRIAQFWRKQLGEYEYVYYNPDDLRRWYIALETRGTLDIRGHLTERNGRSTMPVVTGIVATAPHPPLAIVELWLAAHDKTRTGSYWTAFGAFFLISTFFVPYLHGCTTLVDLNKLASRPAVMDAPIQAAGQATLPGAGSTLPTSAPQPPASAASPTATPTATPTAH